MPPRVDLQQRVKAADIVRLPVGKQAILLATLQMARALEVQVQALIAEITRQGGRCSGGE